MTNITFKNGLPLLLQPAPGSDVGLVAADSGCCCPPPPPERCWCGSDCSYFIRVVEPMAVTNAGYDCVSGADSNAALVEPGLLQAIIPIGPGGGDFAVTNFSQAYAGPGLFAGVTDEIGGFPTFLPEELYYFQLSARRSASISVSCVLEEGQPKYYATIQFSVNVAYIFESLGSFPLGSWYRVYYGRFEIPSTCVVSPERECYPELLGSTEFLRINTPLEITLSGDGTSSLGSLTMTNDGGSGGLPPDFPYAKDALDAIIEETSYTFRITARENCEPLPDPCTVLIDGVRVPVSDFDPYEVVSATWRGLSFPGRDRIFIDGVLVYDADAGSRDSLNNATVAGCDAPGQTDDIKTVNQASGGSGIVNACVTYDSISKYVNLACEVVDETTARLYGGVATAKIYTPCNIDGVPSGDDILEETYWSWECLLVDGVPGAVTVSPLVGARYFNADPVVCEVTHEPPVVTLEFVP